MSSSDRSGEPTAGAHADGSDRPVVLVVEDHGELTDLYGLWLDDQYDLRVAGDARAALELLVGCDGPDGEPGLEAVLLDRRLRGESGTDLLAGVRVAAPGVGVAFVSALEPDLEVAAARPDAYLEKPVSRRSLRTVVEYLRALRSLEESGRRVLAARATARAVAAAVPAAVRRQSHAYQRLTAEAWPDGEDEADSNGGSDPCEAVAAAVGRAAGLEDAGSGPEASERIYHGCPRKLREIRGTRA
jgi:DNA-binding response OmpR family regulator